MLKQKFLISLFLLWNLSGTAWANGVDQNLRVAQQEIQKRTSNSGSRFQSFLNLLLAVDKDCQSNCDTTVKQLEKFNSKFDSNAGLESDLKKSLYERESAKEVSVAPGFKQRLESLLSKNPDSFRMRVRSSLEGIKSLLNIQKETLGNIFSNDSEKRSQSVQELKGDVGFLYEQAKSLYRLQQVAKNLDLKKGLTDGEAMEVARSVSSLGIVYVKLAQTLSTVMDDVPGTFVNVFKNLNADNTDLSPKDAAEILRKELGVEPSKLFRDLDLSKPLSQGSMGYIYSAKIQNERGYWEDVVIKVQRPHLEESIQLSRRYHEMLMNFGKAAVAHISLSPVMDMVADQILGLEKSIAGEMDYRVEMRNMQRFSNYFKLNKDIRVPKVYSQYTTSKVLVMEQIKGDTLAQVLPKVLASHKSKAADPTSIEAKSLKATYTTLLQSLTYMTVVTGEMHADFRPENIMTALKQDAEGLSLEQKMSVVDYGKTISTRGLLRNPMFAGIYLLTGNAEGFTRKLLAISKNQDHLSDSMRELVQKTFDKYGVRKISPKDLFKKQGLNRLTSVRDALTEILILSIKDLKYQVDPRYVELARAVAPVGLTLFSIGSRFDALTIARMSLMACAKGVVFGAIDYFPKWAAKTTERIKESVSNKLERTGVGLRCDNVFM